MKTVRNSPSASKPTPSSSRSLTRTRWQTNSRAGLAVSLPRCGCAQANKARSSTTYRQGLRGSAYYGVIESLDYLDDFIAEDEDKRSGLIYIITDDRRQFQHVAGLLPSGIETVRLYESYLTNFEVNTGRYA
ncbi:hypothetical protein GCM10009604_17640 [Corynebacterium aurimucosum]|uniref:hypothetical protein n=1 Tax=Corynebacterium aurimucosum TaxID=169292 RepID=UPI00191D475D|nr:hypothetical protein [Corynebacterium aurimucosum]QQU95371.1 hypothetical protein I6I66_11570 [Corynebacterium aurimucosum]UTA71724.1 hypothetical protein J3S22_01070 [Corynebacterium aurimucosum]WJY69967.1 hypothetical protein CAURIM_04180 [Corynebacterium aurimucosum]